MASLITNPGNAGVTRPYKEVQLTAKRPLIIGEVLFDEFPSGHCVLGGAPFNVAWNVQGLGLMPLFVSAVGADDEGTEVRARMEAWGMDTRALQVTDRWPTGKVRVELNGDEPRYCILPNQAYDEILSPDSDALRGEFSLLYQGSLAYRSSTSRSTIGRIMREAGIPRFVDINIRQPWFDPESAVELLGDATWIKLNADELAFLANTECHTTRQIAEAVRRVRGMYCARCFFVTCAASGAYAIDQDSEILFVDAPTPTPFIDAVGAGDAFSAAVIVGITRGLPLLDILTSAVQFASNTCEFQGATSTAREHYVLPVPTH